MPSDPDTNSSHEPSSKREGLVSMKWFRSVFRAFDADVKIAILVFLVAWIGCWVYMKEFGVVTGPSENVSDMLRPAVFIASGYGFSDFKALPADIREFLDHKTPRFDRAIPPNPNIKPTNGKFYMDRYYLICAVGLVWRLFGIAWENINILSSFFFGVTAGIVYGIFRLAMRRTLGLAGTALTMLSPVMLVQVPSIRDFTKAPFILATIFLCGYVLMHTMSRKRFFAMAALMGLVVGTGVGFRQDAIICLPLVLLFLIFFARGESPFSVRTRFVGVALVFAGFLPPAWPALSMTADTGGNNSFYLSQGFSAPCLHEVDLAPASYTPIYSTSDYIVHAYIYTFAKTQLAYYKALQGLQVASLISELGQVQAMPATPAIFAASQALFVLNDRLNTWTPPAEKAARRYVYELFTTFPGDVIAKWYAATLRVIRNMQPLYYRSDHSNAALDTACAFEAPFALHLYRYGLFYALAVFLIVAGYDFRTALGALCILVYCCGYPSLEFQCRHAFHLNFASFWFPCFVFDKVLFAVAPRRLLAAMKPPYARPSLAPIVRVTCFAACAAALFCLPLYTARAFQARSVAGLIERYQQADLETLPFVARTDADGKKIYSPSRFPSFERIPPTPLWNVLALTGLPVKRVPDVLVEYVVADIETTTNDVVMDIRYENPDAFFNMGAHYPLLEEPNPCPFRFFFPVFYFTDNFERPYGAPTTTFKGIAFPEGVHVKGFYRVRNKDDFPLLMNVWLPSDPALFRKCQRLKLFTRS